MSAANARRMAQQTLVGREIVGGAAEGRVLYADTGLSFWGGCDPQTGVIVDHTHPLHNECVCGRVLAIPNGRGSCTGSQVVLELLLNGVAPAALLLRTPDVILSLGVIVAEEVRPADTPCPAPPAPRLCSQHLCASTLSGPTRSASLLIPRLGESSTPPRRV